MADDATLKVGVDSSGVDNASKSLDNMSAASVRATSTTEKLSAAAARQQGIFDKLSGSSRKNILSFKDADSAIASLGLTGAAAEKLRTQLGDLGSGVNTKGASDQISKIGGVLDQVSFKSSTARREVLVLISELARGDLHRFGASLLVLAEYTNLASFATSGLGIATAATIIVLGGLAIAATKGAREMHELANALVLTNNFVGQTSDSFLDLARNVAKTNNLGVGNVRELGQALAATGEVGPEVFAAALEATTKFAELTGEKADKVAGLFAKMAESPSKFVLEINKTTNAFTATQFEQIKAMEEAGRSAEAQGFIYATLNDKFKDLNTDLGFLGRQLQEHHVLWSKFWDAVFDVGRPQTIGDKIGDAQKSLDQIRQGNKLLGGGGATGQQAEIDAAAKVQALGQDQALEATAAQAKAVNDRIQKEGIAARKEGDQLLAEAKNDRSRKKALEKVQTDVIDKASQAGAPFSTKEAADIREVVRRKNTLGRGDEASQVARATLAQQIEGFNKALKDEQQDVAFAEKVLEASFEQGNIGITAMYAERTRLVRAGVDAELAEIDKEKTAINSALNDKSSPLFEKDPSTRVNLRTKLNKLDQQAADVRKKAAQQETLDNEKSGLSFLQLQEHVESYEAQILQASGLEERAANLRTTRILQQAQIVAGKASDTAFPLDINALTQALRAQDRLNELKRQSSILDSARGIEEENVSRLIANGTITETQSFQALAEARAAVVPQLQAIVEEQEKIAAKNPLNLQLQVDTAKARLELEKLKDGLDPLARKFQDAFRDQTGSFLFDLMTGKAKPKDAIKTLFEGIGSTISKEVANNFSGQLFGKEGLFSGAGAFVSENLFGQKKPIVKALSAASGIDTTNVQTSLTSLQTTGLDPATGSLQRFSSAVDAATASVQKPGSAAPDATNSGSSGLVPLQTATVQSQPVQSVIAGDEALAQSSATTSDANIRAASSAIGLANAAARGGDALSLLPRIIAAIQAAGIGGKGGPGGLIGSLLGGAGSSAAGGAAVSDTAFGSTTFADAFAGGLIAMGTGGFTGNVDTKKATGIVHGKEFVFNAVAVDSIGLSTLQRMHDAAKSGNGERAAMTVLESLTKGKRELGGPVTSGSLYQVNERNPEILAVGGKQFLMMGNQNGEVKNAPMGRTGDTILHVHVTPPVGASRQTALQWGTEAGRHIHNAIRRNH